MRWRLPGRRTPARLATILGVWILGSPTATWARDCSLRVIVQGDEPARTKLAAALSKADTRTVSPPDPGCADETVLVARAGHAFELTITDPYGRVTRRTVADLEAAAALVEATPGSNALVPLLPDADESEGPIDVPIEVRPPPSSGTAPTPATLAVATRASDGSSERVLSLSFATELATGLDKSSWAGVALNGCVALGPTCVGTTLRFWNDLEPGEESTNAIHRRTTGEIAVAVDVPLALGRFSIRPGAELGLGWVHMGDFSVSPASGDDSDFDQGQVVVGAHFVASYRMARRWALEAGLGATLSIFAHHRPFVVEGTQLPGEPLAFGIISVGLRYGGP